MCLYSKTKECQVAEEPITVYKYVAKRYEILDGEHKGERISIDALRFYTMTQGGKPVKAKPVFASPYYPSANVTYLVGETIKDNSFQATAMEEFQATPMEKYYGALGCVKSIVDRGLHTFKYRKEADYRAHLFVSTDYETAVLRCTIPAGARYFEGYSPHQYCSDTLVVEEVLKEYVHPISEDCHVP